MLNLTTNIAALVIYLCAGGYLILLLTQRRSLQQPWLLPLIGCAVILHSIGIYAQMVTASGIDLGIMKAFSLIMLSINGIVLVSSLRKPLHNLYVILLPISGLAIVLSTFFAQAPGPVAAQLGFGIGAHVILSIIAYSLLALATLQALLLQWQDSHLKKRQLTGLIRHLPPLQTIEVLMFELLWVGVALLTLGILLGALYIDNIFAQHLVHKTILSIIAWAIFALLLWGRVQWGWRGSKATRWILVGFCILMLAYFGSKLVLEVILAPKV